MFIKKGMQLQHERFDHLSLLNVFFFCLFNQETKWPCFVKLGVFMGRGGGVLKKIFKRNFVL